MIRSIFAVHHCHFSSDFTKWGWVKTIFSPPARWGLLDFNRALLLLLLRLLCLLRLLTRRLLLAVPDPSGHSRTSTARSRSQWALPDLNRELQIAVGTAGPQRPDRMPEDMPDGMSDRMPEDMSDRMPEDMPDRMPEDMSDRMPENMPDRMPEDLPDRMPEDMPEDMPDRMPDRMPEDMSDRMPEDLLDRMPEHMPEDMPGHMPEDMPDRMPEDMSERMPEDMPDRMPDRMPEDMPDGMSDRMPEDMPEHMPEDMPDRMPEDMSDRMPEDLPVRKCKNVMVGITRSKVILPYDYCRGRKPSIPQLSWDTTLGYQAFDAAKSPHGLHPAASVAALHRQQQRRFAAQVSGVDRGRLWTRQEGLEAGPTRRSKKPPEIMGVWGEKWEFHWGNTWKLYGRSIWKNGDWSIFKWWKMGIGNGRSMVQEATAQPLCPLLMTRAAHLPGSCSW